MQFDDLLPLVLPEAPSCPDPMALQALVAAAGELCRTSECWDETLDPVALVDGTHTYDVSPPPGALIASIKAVWAGDFELAPATLPLLVRVLPNWQTATASRPDYYSGTPDWRSVRVYPTPANAAGVQLITRVLLMPKLGASSLPDHVGNRYAEVLASGALARLLVQPNRAWSNPALGAYHRQVFEAGMNGARIDALHEHMQGTLTVEPRGFGA